MPYLQFLGLDGRYIGGELTYPNRTSPHTWGTNLHTVPQQYTISPCHAQRYMGICGIHEEFQNVYSI